MNVIKKKLKKCDECDNKKFDNLPLCKLCYNNKKINIIHLTNPKEKDDDDLLNEESSSNLILEKKCQTLECDNFTSFTFCKYCHQKHRNVANEFLS